MRCAQATKQSASTTRRDVALRVGPLLLLMPPQAPPSTSRRSLRERLALGVIWQQMDVDRKRESWRVMPEPSWPLLSRRGTADRAPVARRRGRRRSAPRRPGRLPPSWRSTTPATIHSVSGTSRATVPGLRRADLAAARASPDQQPPPTEVDVASSSVSNAASATIDSSSVGTRHGTLCF